MSTFRPKTAGERAEQDLKEKAFKAMSQAKDPVEKLRFFCLSRGATGILGIGRYLLPNRDNLPSARTSKELSLNVSSLSECSAGWTMTATRI